MSARRSGFFALLLVGFAPAGAAAEGGAEEAVIEAVRRHVAERVGVRTEDVDVGWLGLGAAWRCPPGAAVHVESSPREDFRGHADLRLTGVAGGEVCTDVRVRPRVTVWVEAPVAARPAEPGETVSLATGRVPLALLAGAPVEEGSGPWEARTHLDAGDPVTARVVRPVPDARRGDPVTLEVERGALRVTVAGRLVEDARLGEVVKVASPSTTGVVEGVLVEPDLVRAGGGR